MRLCDLVSVKQWLPLNSTLSDPFWESEVSLVTDTKIQLFYARAGARGNQKDAIDAIDLLQTAVILSTFKGELVEPPACIIMHELPDDPFFVDELVDALNKLTPVRQKACLYALEGGFDLSVVTSLTWKNVFHVQKLSPVASAVIKISNKTRHMKLPYVFWEWSTPTIAAPLLEFAWTVERAFGCSWPQLVRKYKRLIPIDRNEDAEAFLKLTIS